MTLWQDALWSYCSDNESVGRLLSLSVGGNLIHTAAWEHLPLDWNGKSVQSRFGGKNYAPVALFRMNSWRKVQLVPFRSLPNRDNKNKTPSKATSEATRMTLCRDIEGTVFDCDVALPFHVVFFEFEIEMAPFRQVPTGLFVLSQRYNN